MKCSNCSYLIKSWEDSNFCGECHLSPKSKKLKKKESNSHLRKKEEKDYEKLSPFLIKGFLNKKIQYNSKYQLENFTPVYKENNEIETIGSGSFGQVYKASNKIDNKYYAIKHMNKRKLLNILHTLNGIKQEIDIQSRIEHPNIVKILYADEDDDSFDLVMEYAENGNLFHYIRKNKSLNELKTFQLFIQVVNAINFLHENDLIHRDIKPENILLFNNFDKINKTDYIVKLCDFGWCVKLDGKQRDTFCGTTEYMSPELVNHKVYSKEIDVWSLGVLLYEMIHGYSPFRPNKPKFSENEVFENIKKHILKFDKKISDECKRLIYNLLAFNKNKRFKVEEIYNSQFVKKFEKLNIFTQKENNINLTKKNSYIYNEENNYNKNSKNKNSKNKNTKKIYEVNNEFKNLDWQELRKLLRNNIIEHKIIKSLSKKKNLDNQNQYNLRLVFNNYNKNSISFINNNLSKNYYKNKSSNDIFVKKDLIQDKNYSSLQNELNYEYKKKAIKNKNSKKEKFLNYTSFIKSKEKKKKNIIEKNFKNKKKSKTNSILSIEINSNSNSCRKKNTQYFNDFNNCQSISYRLKEIKKNGTNEKNKSMKNKNEIQNLKNENLKETQNEFILIKNRTYGNEKQDNNKINKKVNMRNDNDNKDLKKIKSISNIKKKYNNNNKRYKNSFIFENINNEIIKKELFNQQIKKNPFEGMKMKSKTNFNLNQSDEIKHNKSKIIINNSNIKDHISSDRKIMNSKNNKQKKINTIDNTIFKNINNSPKFIQNANSAQPKNKSYNRIRVKNNYKNNITYEQIYINNNDYINNINISFYNNLFQGQEKENKIFRIQSDKFIFKNKENKMKSNSNGNSNIKTQKSENNKKYNNKKIKKITNIKVNSKNQNMHQISNIKLRNKRSFCFISRNKLFPRNKHHHIFYGPINKIDNINYLSNNINNFYIINGANTSIDNYSKMKQKILKKQITEEQRRDLKNINYQKLIIPFTFLQNERISENENIKNNENGAKSVSKSKSKLSLKNYKITKKNKISHSYNKNNNIKKKENLNKEKDTNFIIDGISEKSNDNNNEKNITPKKNKDNVKINPIKLLGQFKKGI